MAIFDIFSRNYNNFFSRLFEHFFPHGVWGWIIRVITFLNTIIMRWSTSTIYKNRILKVKKNLLEYNKDFEESKGRKLRNRLILTDIFCGVTLCKTFFCTSKNFLTNYVINVNLWNGNRCFTDELLKLKFSLLPFRVLFSVYFKPTIFSQHIPHVLANL